MDFVVGYDVRMIAFMGRMKPYGADPGIFAALDIRRKAVPDDDGRLLFKTRDALKTAGEIGETRFVKSDFFGNKDAF